MGKLEALVQKGQPEKSLIALLEVRFADPSDPGVPERAHLIRQVVTDIPAVQASYFYDRLSAKKSKEKVTLLFNGVLSTSFRNSILKTLKNKSDNYRSVLTPIPPLTPVKAGTTAVGFKSGRLSAPPAGPSVIAAGPRPFFPFQKAADDPKAEYTEKLKSKINFYLGIENRSIKEKARQYLYSPQSKKASVVPASTEWNVLDDRLLFIRYYLDAVSAKEGFRIDKDQFIDMILQEELKYEKQRGIGYNESFPTADFSARYGSLNTNAAGLRDFRCGTTHHRFGQPPDPPHFEPEPTALEIFWMLLEEMHLEEQQYYDLDAQIRKEKFSDGEINFIFSHAYVYRQYLVALKYNTTPAGTTLRKYIAEYKKQEEYIKKYGNPNDPGRLMKVDPNRIKSTIFRASQNKLVMAASAALKVLESVYKRIAPYLSFICDFIPYVGQIKGLIEGVAGVDILTGDELSGWQRVLAVLPAGIEHCGSIVKGAKIAARAASKAAKSPELLVILTLAAKSGKHPVEIINNMKAIAAMSEKAVIAAKDEVKIASGAKTLVVTENQAEALNEVRKTVDKIKASPKVALPSISKYAPQAEAAAAAAKHAAAIGGNGDPAVSSRGNKDRITSQTPKPKPGPLPGPDDTPALPPGKKSSRKERRRSKKKPPPKKAPPRKRPRRSLKRKRTFTSAKHKLFRVFKHFSKRGYQVYIMRDADGIVLYVGKSGGLEGKELSSWVDRLYSHSTDASKVDWISEVDTISIRSDLSWMEAASLEEDLIRETWATSYNRKIEDYVSRNYGEDVMIENSRAARKRQQYTFHLDIHE